MLKVSKSNLIVGIALFFMIFRIVIDVIWSSTKPTMIIGLYSLFGLLLSVYFLMRARMDRKLPLVVFLYPCTLLASQFYSDVSLFEHLKFALQIYIPCLFLVAATNVPRLMHQASLAYKRYLSFGVIFVLMVASYVNYTQNALPGASYYQHYANDPNHVIAQTLLKSSLPLITSGFLWVAIPFALIFTLNVRSVVLAYFLSLIMAHRFTFFKKKAVKKLLIWGLPLVVFAVAQVDWIEVYDRVIFKGQMTDQTESVINSASSGRLYIYQFYANFIFDNFGLKEWLIGYGPFWLAPGGPELGPHNDVLTFIISFGLLGSLATTFCYFYFFMKLPSGNARYIFLLAFLVLFLTNGVASHQSNILFALLYIFWSPVYSGVNFHDKLSGINNQVEHPTSTMPRWRSTTNKTHP